MSMVYPEVRPFESRFGDRCPLCGKSWGDPSPCGDSRAERTIRDSLSLIFADRKGNNCAACQTEISVRRRYCYDCSERNAKTHNAGDRHKRIQSVCQWPPCSKLFTHRKDKARKFCSLKCGSLNRWNKVA